MNKKGKTADFFHRLESIKKMVKSTYLYRIVSKFLSVVCTIILVLLLIVGALMFYFNMKAKSYENKGLEYISPFGLYTIISGSMEPNVSVYDVVITVDEDINKIKVGDIITFISTWDFNRDVTVTHRVVDITKNENGEYQLITKGDNNQSKDGSHVTQSNLIGKVVGRLPQLGRLQYFLATKMGWLIVVFIPALSIIIFDIIKIFKLYVLKDQIEKVKSRKEALAIALGEPVKPETPREELIHPTIDTIISDTVSDETAAIDLPIVDIDGKLKELNKMPVSKEEKLPLPIKQTVSEINGISELDIPQSDKGTINQDLPIVINKEQNITKKTIKRSPLKRR